MPGHRVSGCLPLLRAAAGALLLSIAVVGIAYPLWWNHRSSNTGQALLQRTYPAAIMARPGKVLPTCGSQPGGSVVGAPRQQPGVLKIPAIGLTAPVLQGLGHSVLDVAVGHDPVTVWPGAQGESILLAHDVSYFSGLDKLKPGATVTWSLGCERSVFRVMAVSVTRPGAIIPAPASGSGLALITCWPTNALFWTPERYIVQTVLVTQQSLRHPTSPLPSSFTPLEVSAPHSLAAEGLSPVQSGITLGHLTISGSPSSSFREGPDPLMAANIALREYVAAAKTAAAGNRSWWSALAVTGLPLPARWSLVYDTNVTLVVKGSVVEQVMIFSPAAQ